MNCIAIKQKRKKDLIQLSPAELSGSVTEKISACLLVIEYELMKCGNEALLKTSWTQLNPGRRFLCCKISKKMGGCDYFFWIEDRHPAQANRAMWGLLKKVKAFEEKRIRARNMLIVAAIVAGFVMLGIWKIKPNC
ncbi:uncharacterized protein LOC132614895 [Lycium barbarum]|uniref:uncharacterized protein LOC132614895 n=1 Tax=Lycium barbarum TaxID=112863 RepID=UPI00293ED1B2|nr:uncharacterized protein LOC132614895 [Lycium barbarum]